MAEKIPGSVSVGSRPINSRTRAYSCGVSPCSATSSGVIFGSLGNAGGSGIAAGCCISKFGAAFLLAWYLSRLSEMRHEPGEQAATVRRADHALHVVFRVRHQPQHIELLREHARKGVDRAVDVPGFVARTVRGRIAEQHPPLVLEPRDRG